MNKWVSDTYGSSPRGPIAGSYNPPGTGLSKVSSNLALVIFTKLCLWTSSSVKKLNATESTDTVAPCKIQKKINKTFKEKNYDLNNFIFWITLPKPSKKTQIKNFKLLSATLAIIFQSWFHLFKLDKCTITINKLHLINLINKKNIISLLKLISFKFKLVKQKGQERKKLTRKKDK